MLVNDGPYNIAPYEPHMRLIWSYILPEFFYRRKFHILKTINIFKTFFYIIEYATNYKKIFKKKYKKNIIHIIIFTILQKNIICIIPFLVF